MKNKFKWTGGFILRPVTFSGSRVGSYTIFSAVYWLEY